MNSQTWAMSPVVGLVVAGLAVSCAHSEEAHTTAPVAAANRNAETATTVTTAAPAPGGSSSSLTVSEDIRRACDIHFDTVAQAPKFDFDTSELRADDSALLGQVAQCLTTGPLKGRSIRLVGRADPRGETEYNFSLGGRRAASVEQYLRALGVDPTRMVQTSRGKLDASGTDEETWRRDRRVDIDLL